MGRPPDYEWAVLGEGEDPIPGDPHEVRAESTRLGKMAQTIRDQISLLKDIAGDENVGKFADRLRDAADELKGDLGKVATRYESVSGYLGNWAGDLEYCQSESIKALTKAQQAAPAAKAPDPSQAANEHQKLTPQEQQQQAAAAKARTAAQGDIDAAKRQLDNAKHHRDDRGSYWKGKIEDSDHDDLKDSWWDGVKDFIHEHAGWIKILADACTWIVTALVIISLFIPGLDIATGLLLGLMLTALAGHTALALSGDGSWVDVGMDLFALVTLGGASFAKAGLQGSVDFAETAAKSYRAASDVEEVGSDVAKAAADGSELEEGASQSLTSRVTDAVSDWGKAVGEKFMAGGEKPVVENMAKLRQLAEEFPNTRLFPNTLARSGSFLNQVRMANGAANVADEFGHWAGGSDDVNFVGNLVHGTAFEDGAGNPNVEGDTSPHWDEFGRLKELTTWGVGS